MKKLNLIEWLSRNSHEKQKMGGMRRYAAMLLLLLTCATHAWAGTSTTVYYAVPAATVGSYSVKCNTNHKGDGDDWHAYNMSLSRTVNFAGTSLKVYSCTFTDTYDGLGKLQFQLYNGDSWVSQIEPISSWTGPSTYNGKIYFHSGNAWHDYPVTYSIASGSTIVWDLGENNVSWSNVYLYKAVNCGGPANNEAFSQIGTTTQWIKTYASTEYNDAILFRNNNSDTWTNHTHTTDISRNISGVTLFTYDNSDNNGSPKKLNWQITENAKKATSGVKIYFDNTASNWNEIWLRYGTTWFVRSSAAAATQVPGTENLYVITIPNDAYYASYHLANNYGATNYSNITSNYNLTDKIALQSSNLASEITYIPTTNDSGSPKTWSFNTITGGHTRRLTFGSHTNGNITVTYTDENGDEQTVSSASASYVDVAQTCNVVITAVPNDGYAPSGLTLGGSPITSGATQTIRANGEIAATFVAETTYNITVSYKYGSRTLHDDKVVKVGVTTPSLISSETVNGFQFSAWSDLTNVKNNTGNLITDPISINSTTAAGSMTCNYTPWTCKLHVNTTSGNTTYTSEHTMSYDATAKAYYKEITTGAATEYYRFFINSKKYAPSSNTEVVIAGTKVAAATDVTGYAENMPSVYFDDGGVGSKIKVWFDYENQEAWVEEVKYTVTISAGANGSVSPTSVSVGNVVASGTISATSDDHYHWSSWSVPDGVTIVSGSGTKDITIKATADSKIVTASFAGDVYTITYRDQGDVAYSGNNQGSLPATHTYGTATALVNGAKTGYTFGGWYTDASCTISAGSSIGATSKTANFTLYAKWTENMTNVTLVASPAGKGTFTIGGDAATSTTAGVTTTRSVTAVPAAGYHLTGTIWSKNNENITLSSTTANPTTVTGCGASGTSSTLTATFTPITYTIHFNGNGNTSGSMSDQTGVTYDAATTITANAFVKTGYKFAGWGTTQERANAGTVDRTDGAAHGNLASTQGATAQLWAVWTPKQSAITFDYQTGVTGYSSSGDITNATGLKGIYDADMTALTGTMPSADEGYAFTGFYDATSGGTKYYNANGTSAHAWDKDTESGTTLYARWEKAEITNLALDAATVEPEATVGVTPTISPTPAGTTFICWEVQYAATGNPLSPQPSNMSYSEGKLTFDAPAASGLYKIVATLKTGNDCAGGTTLSSNYVSVQVAGSHTVTVQYHDGSGNSIKANTSVTARPLDWSEEAITAPNIFGYSFSSWSAGDGITITDDDGATSGTSSTNATIKIKATYDGTLTANYTPKQLIYFKNTLGWENVYVNFYKSDYWNDSKGSGNNGVPVQNKTMTQLGETDIWYYDYGSDDFTGYTNTKPTNYVSFTNESRSSAENFWGSGTGILVSYPARRADDLADKSGETGFYESTPMFVPLAGQAAITKNEGSGGKALYYNSGYWTKYLPGTGYTLEFYDNGTGAFIKSMDFTSADELMPMKAVADLEAGTTYKFQIKRHGDVYLGNSGTMTYSDHGQATPWEMTNTDFAMCRLTTTAFGDYTFNFTYSANTSNEYRMRLSVDYPVSDGDYRLIYSDAVHTKIHPSAIVNKVNDGTDIVSFFVRHDETPVLRIQQASVDGSGNITWNEYPNSGTPTNQITGDIASAIDATGVYNFNLSMNGSGAMTVTSAEDYTGNFYIRTDAANSKWDNYRTDPDHLMTYSEYSITHGGYSHYYTHWVNKDDVGRKNVKFVIANDYSPCISDTLARETASGTWANIATFMEEGGDLKRSANVRFMWNSATNEVSRAYIDGSQEDGSQFLLLLSDDSKIKQGGATKTQVTFNDNGNWLYEANVSALPNAQIKLRSTWGEGTTIVQYFKGASDATEILVGGSGDDEYNFRLIYDFKTNRLLASYVPATGTISTNVEINADVMFVREHQGDIAQLTFSGSGAISEIQTAYGVLRFNKWTLNNKDKSTHNPLPVPQPSRFERDLFYISFPFRVNLEEVFGFGTYGTHWIIEEYDGAARARDGYWADSKSFWKFITNRKGKFLEPNKGYILALDLDELGESSSVWANTDQVELYFPSYGTMPDITKATVTHELEAHTCNIGPRFAGGDDRRVKDSHWNVMSVPTYINTTNVTFANTTWITAGDGQLGPNFLYTVNWSDNSLTATSGKDYTYKAMHAYIVQYCGNVTWTTSVSPATAPNRNPNAPKDAEYRLELRQNDVAVDQAFVRLSNDEQVTTGFDFNYDLSKEFNKNKANIYTMVTTQMADGPSITETAGNTLPMTNQTTIVPVGVKIAADGEYTFSIPEGTYGIGITLIDNEAGARVNLGLMDYTVTLAAGQIDDRFVLEISPISQISTDVEAISDEGLQVTGARKIMIDGLLYIVKDGVVYDAQGRRL